MKKIIYQVIGRVHIYNTETKEVEQQECASVVERKCPTQAAYDVNYPIAEKEAVPGTIEVIGEFDPEPITDAQRIAELEEALELLLSGTVE